RALCLTILLVWGLLLQGCSTVKLAYNQVPQLAYWQLNRYLDLSDAQTDRVRSELDLLHQWHRSTMLPQHARLLQQVQQHLPGTVTPEQACRIYDDARIQLDAVWAQAEQQLLWLAPQLSPAQIRTLEMQQAQSNVDWKKQWLDASPEQMREQRYKQLLSRAETFYGTLDEPAREALRSYVARSSFDPQRSYAERLRRQKDLVEVLQGIAQNGSDHQRTLGPLRGYRTRYNASPDPAYQRYAQRLVEEGCEAFARMHNAMAPAQRLQAVQSLKGYERDFWVLAAQ
ncbi:MAG: hypothetical protein QG643_970, partial [Pseudomonadota bacterium]|nr:hypothetical protein [Pseudomonadota bacterium]